MRKYLYGIGIFVAGVIVGWLNPIEGPLDWTYDQYASQPAHRSPTRIAPSPKKEKPLFIWFFEEEEEGEELTVPPIIQAIQEE